MFATGIEEKSSSGGFEMLLTGDVGDWLAEVDQVLRHLLTLQATVHHDAELVCALLGQLYGYHESLMRHLY